MAQGRRLVLFDLDGTLVDSTPGIWASVRVAAAELGLPEPTPEQLTQMVGPPLQDGFALVLGIPTDDVPRAVAAYRAHYGAGALLDVDVYDGIPELLATLSGGRSHPRRRDEQAGALRRPRPGAHRAAAVLRLRARCDPRRHRPAQGRGRRGG